MLNATGLLGPCSSLRRSVEEVGVDYDQLLRKALDDRYIHRDEKVVKDVISLEHVTFVIEYFVHSITSNADSVPSGLSHAWR